MMTDVPIAERVRTLATVLTEAGFARLRVRDGETEIELRRAALRPVAASPLPSDPERVVERIEETIVSDVVGIVHLLRPPVTEGTELEADRELAYVETLGIRNSVRARGGGRVRSVLVGEGEPVEFGQPLFIIER
jgi:acetyl-CoA carboxylase biotin carboxyl carrier protein